MATRKNYRRVRTVRRHNNRRRRSQKRGGWYKGYNPIKGVKNLFGTRKRQSLLNYADNYDDVAKSNEFVGYHLPSNKTPRFVHINPDKFKQIQDSSRNLYKITV